MPMQACYSLCKPAIKSKQTRIIKKLKYEPKVSHARIFSVLSCQILFLVSLLFGAQRLIPTHYLKFLIFWLFFYYLKLKCCPSIRLSAFFIVTQTILCSLHPSELTSWGPLLKVLRAVVFQHECMTDK